jgi:hypothetical protein
MIALFLLTINIIMEKGEVMNAYQKNYNCFIKNMGEPAEKAVFIPKDSKPFWIIYQNYLSGARVVCATRNQLRAVTVCLNNKNRFIRVIGNPELIDIPAMEYGLSREEKADLEAIWRVK